jgi:hypothetical protein
MKCRSAGAFCEDEDYQELLGGYVEDRIDALDAATLKFNRNSTPIMTAEQWAAAREVCSGR